MENLNDLGEPADVWEYFVKICSIPRSTGKEDQIREFIKEEAENFGFQTKIDGIKNIAVILPSGYNSRDKRTKIILQSHMDMVCLKDASSDHDFSKDPLKLQLNHVDEEKWVSANGTTLGADNGIGIALQLAIMKKIHDKAIYFEDTDITLLFTVCEEFSAEGAIFINKDLLEGDYLINLDSETEGEFIIGSAGILVYRVGIKMERSFLDEKNSDLIPVKLSVKGLTGGHSGVDINKGRASAIKLITQILWKLNRKFIIYLNSFKGGTWFSSIASNSEAVIFIESNNHLEIRKYVSEIYENIQIHYTGIEENFDISIEELSNFTDYTCFSKEYQDKILNVMFSLPFGPDGFHPKKRGLVFTSNNIGPIRSMRTRVEFDITYRSFSQYGLNLLQEKVFSLLQLSGMKYKVYNYDKGPVWEPDFNSEISLIAKKTYERLFRKDVKIEAIHGGLECAEFKKHNPKLEQISIGVTILNAHSTEECLNVGSVQRFWKFLLLFLSKLKK